MQPTITPNAARLRRKAERAARAEYLAAVEAFRAAMSARRAAGRALAAMRAPSWELAQALGERAGVAFMTLVRTWEAHPYAVAERAMVRAAGAAEEACSAMFDRRFWYQQTIRSVRAIDSGAVRVETGAAWSERGLENVQRANRCRP